MHMSQPLMLGDIETYPLASRNSKVRVRDFAKPIDRGASVSQLLDAMPNILAVRELRDVLRAIHTAKKQGKAILWGIGGHVIKVGLGPLLIDLMRRGFVSGIAMNGAALVHDFEIALAGHTSEDVEAGLGEGRFGMAAETGECINQIAKMAARVHIGYGQAAGQFLTSAAIAARLSGLSVLAAAYKKRIPVTIHVAIGTDTPHMHRTADGAALGAASHYDFRVFCALVRQMHPGGVYLNWGSAVLLPEIFLKAIAVVRNLGVPLRPICTANFDFIQHYRPLQNVVKRPTAPVGRRRGKESRGYAITGHHEIIFPLVAAALVSGWPPYERRRKTPGKKR